MSNISSEIVEKLDRINTEIKETEIALNQFGAGIPVEFGLLKWKRHNNNRFRIYMDEKPLIEHRIESRIRGFKDLKELKKLAIGRVRAVLEEALCDE